MCEVTTMEVPAESRAPAYPPIKLLASGIDVELLFDELMEHPELWNQHQARTEQYAHSNISDIWLRYNDLANYNGDLKSFNDKHESVWYQTFDALPAAGDIIFNTMRFVMGERLGGVLITKIPPGTQVKPHVDRGWHAEYYQKFAIQIAGNSDQVFCFDDTELVTETGDLFTFDNQRTHWVRNDSDIDRITMIICIRSSSNWLAIDEGD